jgi:PAS domain-containing protein
VPSSNVDEFSSPRDGAAPNGARDAVCRCWTAARDGLCALDRDGRVVYVNAQGARVLGGAARAELIGRGATESSPITPRCSAAPANQASPPTSASARPVRPSGSTCARARRRMGMAIHLRVAVVGRTSTDAMTPAADGALNEPAPTSWPPSAKLPRTSSGSPTPRATCST